jgi:hypothetical protein
MENYLSGRGAGEDIDLSKGDSSFRPFLSQPSPSPVEGNTTEPSLSSEGKSQIVFDEKDCPKVEVISVDQKPRQIVIHLNDGRLLKINCEYSES